MLGAVDTLIQGLWARLPNLSVEDLSFMKIPENLICFDEYSLGNKHLQEIFMSLPDKRIIDRRFKARVNKFLDYAIENVYQHAQIQDPYIENQGLGVNFISDNAVKSLMVSAVERDRLSIYIMDTGKGFVNNAGDSVLFAVARSEFSEGLFGLGFKTLIDKTDQFYGISKGVAIAKIKKDEPVKKVDLSLVYSRLISEQESLPKGAFICGRFNLV